jgi:hypothetical protein
MFDFAVRDDDINYYTDPDELASVWESYDVPVSLGVVPKHGATRSPAVPEDLWYDLDPGERFPLAENEALVEYLRGGVESGKYAVCQHGYDHVRTPAGPEFARHGTDALHEKLVAGREHLEETLGTAVDAFVPPDGMLSNAGLSALKRERMPTFHYPTPRGRPRTLELGRTLAADALFKYRYRPLGRSAFVQDLYRLWGVGDRSVSLPTWPAPYRLDGGWEFASVSLLATSSLKRIRRQLRLADELGGRFCLAVHYYDFESRRFREKFESLLQYAREELDPDFVHCGSLFP